ncbi:FG-GAP repeat domain-containing protein [Streptomyces sp. NPDC053253]|uniref:FG-GAP repeat domain-containing protein n=1 Tax=Streptomyces sp. NPDC053253 TaxID=3365699 RepID=UPI0037D1647A
MKQQYGTTRRVAVAVAVTLAVTAGSPAVPAFAMPPVMAPAASDAPQGAISVPHGTVALSGGPTGFLTRHKEGESEVYTWTRYADGVRTRLPGGKYEVDPGTDTVVRTDGTTRTFLDMPTGEELVSYDLAAHGEAGAIASVAYRGTTLVVTRKVEGKWEVHLIDKDERGQDVDRKVTGLPETWWWRGEQNSDPSTLMLRGFVSSDGTGGQKLAFVDLATASVTATHDILNVENWITPVGGSRTRAVWQEKDATGKTVLAVARRGSLEVARTTWAREARGSTLALGVTGDWVVYGNSWAFGAWNTEGLRDLTARSLTTDETFPLLAHATSVVQAADGGLIATGGTVEHGEGVYRITPGANGGRPTVSVLATTGVPTALTARSEPQAPTGVVDLDAAEGKVPFGWTLDRPGALVTLKVVHTASRATGTLGTWQEPGGPSEFRLDWDGFLSKFPAYAGAYTWTMTAVPRNGIGPAVERTGSFVVAPRAPRRHDFDGNGSPDVFGRSPEGFLYLYDVGQLRQLTYDEPAHQTLIGGGWNAYDQIVRRSTGLVARDKDGVLWTYESKGGGTLSPRKRVGGGWNVYAKLTSGSDFTGDGREDLVATDKAGVLWTYPAKADGTFAARRKVGGGWGAYHQIAAIGNIGGAAAGDLVARDKDGALWLYLGKGDGTFAPRSKIGGGWRALRVIGAGDVDGDGKNDLVSVNWADYSPTYLHLRRGTSQWKTPFEAAMSPSGQFQNVPPLF